MPPSPTSRTRRLAIALPVLAALPARAQTGRPASLRIVVAAPPGNPVDLMARLLASELGRRFGPMQVDNRADAGGDAAAHEVARSAPDNRTLLVAPDTVLSLNPLLRPAGSFDVRQQLQPLSMMGSFPQMLVCDRRSPVKTAHELLLAARQRPARYATEGIGSPSHAAMLLLLAMTQVPMAHASMPGWGAAVAAAGSGAVECAVLSSSGAVPYIRAGQLKALAVLSPNPSALMPEVPTITAALGRPELAAPTKIVLLVARGGFVPALVAFERSIGEILQQPHLHAPLASIDLRLTRSSIADATATLSLETNRWLPLVRSGLSFR